MIIQDRSSREFAFSQLSPNQAATMSNFRKGPIISTRAIQSVALPRISSDTSWNDLPAFTTWMSPLGCRSNKVWKSSRTRLCMVSFSYRSTPNPPRFAASVGEIRRKRHISGRGNPTSGCHAQPRDNVGIPFAAEYTAPEYE